MPNPTSFRSINPATGQLLAEYPSASPSEIRAALKQADKSWHAWRRVPVGERAAVVRRVGSLLRERVADYAQTITTEMGKPIAAARAEVEKCATMCDYYAEHGEQFLTDEPTVTDASMSMVHYEPIGPVLAIMPWNFPFWQVLRFAAPTLIARNVAVLKHAGSVPGCAIALERLLRDAGAPAGVFQSLFIEHNDIRRVIRNASIRAVTLTGSTRAGKTVGKLAGENLKKAVLELGGSDAYVVLEDADLDAAVEACVTSRLINSGQSCIAAKRFVVVDAIREPFIERFVARMRAVTMGDPMDEKNQIGPLARADLRDQLHDQVQRTLQRGAQLLLGGEVPPGPGAYYPPTVIAGVERGMPAYEEELFGPVAAIIAAKNEKAAIRIANDTSFGLGAAVFTSDADRGIRIAAAQLEAGSCFVNTFVRSDPRLPFGGIKQSGYGRELARQGMLEFVNVKTVWAA